MGQSLSNLLVHIIFSTKHCHPYLKKDHQSRLHPYLAEIVRDLRCQCYRVGGVEDHVHLAVRLKSTLDLAKLIEKLKCESSKWIKPLSPELSSFSWQRGYGAFSISPHYRKRLIEYIDNQEEHHRHVSFQDEFRKFLKKYEIPYDERYVGGLK